MILHWQSTYWIQQFEYKTGDTMSECVDTYLDSFERFGFSLVESRSRLYRFEKQLNSRVLLSVQVSSGNLGEPVFAVTACVEVPEVIANCGYSGVLDFSLGPSGLCGRTSELSTYWKRSELAEMEVALETCLFPILSVFESPKNVATLLKFQYAKGVPLDGFAYLTLPVAQALSHDRIMRLLQPDIVAGGKRALAPGRARDLASVLALIGDTEAAKKYARLYLQSFPDKRVVADYVDFVES